MSEPKLISPMLDNYDMGGPISDHDGVRCCPAMRKNSDDKFIVKIISVPASQTKLDALLLTGAYSDKESALAYFYDVAEGIVAEKNVLDDLAKLEGFIAFDDCQVVSMTDGTGYDVYLLAAYRKTLERSVAKKPMTQLDAVNLGIDLCQALTVCRRSGFMFVDLKPSNIFLVGDKGYCIGDLGFVRLNSLKYESLPDKYRSSYTAPEVEDAFALLNDTMDIYAVGMILYQVFNGWELPSSDALSSGEKLEAPRYADEEMAQIILKACDPDPSERWSDPVQMGQAIVSYMQKNGVNDIPLTAENFSKQEAAPEAPAVEITSENEDTEIPEVVIEDSADEIVEQADEDSSSDDALTEAVIVPTEPADDVAIEEVATEQAAEAVEIPAEPEVDDNEPAEEAECADVDAEDDTDVQPVEEEADVISEESSGEEDFDNLSFLNELGELALPEEEDEPEDIADILDQVDALVAHQVPDPVVAPEPIEVKIPEPITEEEPEDAEEASENSDEVEAIPEEDTDIEDEIPYEDLPEDEKPYIPKKKRKGLTLLIVFIILAALAVGGYFFYTQYYLQPIQALDIVGTEDILQVQITADIDDTLLTVVCADPHGNNVSSPVVGGKAVFSGLAPDTAYTVTVEVDGLHKLTGTTSRVYSTPLQTKVAQISVVTGAESGSVILSFTVEGPDSDQWNVIYNAEGEAERITTFPAHMVTLTGLTVGKEYTFRLEPVEEIYLSGDAEITYVAKNLVCAENLHVSGCADGVLTIQWDTPAGETVSEWNVRCSNAAGFDATLTTTENIAKFENIDDTAEFTVVVTAADMSVNQSVQISANSITVTDFTVAPSSALLSLSWKANREIPAEGWTIRYSVNGVNAPATITTKENSASIPGVPNGNFVFTILDGNGNTVLGGPFTYVQNAAPAFEAYNLKQSDITVRLCKTPASSSWSYKDLKDEDYVNTFAAGQKVSMVLAASKTPSNSDAEVNVTYLIYDENDNLVSYSHDAQIWRSMWYQDYCELDLNGIPADVGTYKIVLLINGAEVGSQKFAITA